MDSELFKWLLTVDASQLSVPGLLLAFIGLLLVGLHKEWFVSGPRWRADQAADAINRAALEACNQAVKQREDAYTEARLELVALRKDREYGWPTSHRPERPS